MTFFSLLWNTKDVCKKKHTSVFLSINRNITVMSVVVLDHFDFYCTVCRKTVKAFLNTFLYVPQKKWSHTGLEWHEGALMMTEFSLQDTFLLYFLFYNLLCFILFQKVTESCYLGKQVSQDSHWSLAMFYFLFFKASKVRICPWHFKGRVP